MVRRYNCVCISEGRDTVGIEGMCGSWYYVISDVHRLLPNKLHEARLGVKDGRKLLVIKLELGQDLTGMKAVLPHQT